MRKRKQAVSLLPGDNRRSGKVFWIKLATVVIVLATILAVAVSISANGIAARLPSFHVKNVQAASSSQQSIDTPNGQDGLAKKAVQATNTAQTTNSAQTANVSAASGTERRIDIPYFNSSPVAFNQTAIFWFGKIDSSHVYADVRVGYNNTELYIDLRIVDNYLWYDTNKQAPNLDAGDNASVYLNIENNGTLAPTAYKFQTAVSGPQQWNTYEKTYTKKGAAWTLANMPFSYAYWWRAQGFNGTEGAGWSSTYHIPFSSLGLSKAPSQGTVWKLGVRLHNPGNAANTPMPDH